MARRKSNKGNKGSVNGTAVCIGAVAAVVLGILAFSGGGSKRAAVDNARNFSIADYRTDASRYTNNRYSIEGRVENIETLGNDRLIAVSVTGNSQERLPLLVRSGVAQGVNLTRGDTFLFEVECCTGHDNDQKEIKGVLVVRRVETK